MLCPIHHIIDKQTFSLAEMEFYIAQAENLKICDQCQYLFKNRIERIVFNDTVRNGKTRPDATVTDRRDKRIRRS
jgi:hypothetical protein